LHESSKCDDADTPLTARELLCWVGVELFTGEFPGVHPVTVLRPARASVKTHNIRRDCADFQSVDRIA
jgi:hypothetical protein